MEAMKRKLIIQLLLIFLIVLDLVYAVICFFFPQTWFDIFHGAGYVDPQGLLRRTGAIWATFALIQIITLIRWQQKPYWIAVLSGVRMSEIFADWTYLAFAQDLTNMGRIALLLATPMNLAVSLFLFKSYLSLSQSSAGEE
jgi:hypothetical protein